ncbi:MAG: hypothetical protein HOM16_12660 [Woeseia sp.]|jgi:hypothetical protein|nr:hypothetical protein [Woeseia sp.]MBT7865873.1 hypothetical protein [Opitutales bacterium]
MRIYNSICLLALVVLLAACDQSSNPVSASSTENTTVGSYNGVWKTSYGDVYFPKYTSNDVRGAYWSYPESNGKADNGRILGSIDGDKLVGYWVEDSGESPCETEKDGSLFWGRVSFKANEDFSVISGGWGGCDNEPDGGDAGWVGTREK